jgi:hypothetical protein
LLWLQPVAPQQFLELMAGNDRALGEKGSHRFASAIFRITPPGRVFKVIIAPGTKPAP